MYHPNMMECQKGKGVKGDGRYEGEMYVSKQQVGTRGPDQNPRRNRDSSWKEGGKPFQGPMLQPKGGREGDDNPIAWERRFGGGWSHRTEALPDWHSEHFGEMERYQSADKPILGGPRANTYDTSEYGISISGMQQVYEQGKGGSTEGYEKGGGGWHRSGPTKDKYQERDLKIASCFLWLK